MLRENIKFTITKYFGIYLILTNLPSPFMLNTTAERKKERLCFCFVIEIERKIERKKRKDVFIFIIDIQNSTKEEIRLFTDDTNIFLLDKDPTIIRQRVNRFLSDLTQWLSRKDQFQCFYAQKCQCS